MRPNAALNLQILRDLFGEDNDVIREILETYADDLQKQSLDLYVAANDRDRTQFKRIAHSLKGASANVGASEFAGFCSVIEQKSAGAPWNELEDASRELADTVAALGVVVREHITSL